MKQIYNKIYEAINTGIQKALILDDEDDISMNYQHKKIVNNANLMPYYIEELLYDSNNKAANYRKILKYYKETGYTYKVKDLNELRNIIDKIKNFKNVSFEWIENMKDYISIVLDDNSEIYFNEKTDKTPLFLKFANDDILGTENEILIYLYKNHISTKRYQWQTEEAQIQSDEYLIDDENKANKDYSGYETCLRIQSISSKEPEKYGEIPAIDYCLNQIVNGYQGYLPSMGQLRIMSDNIDIINYIFKYLNLNEIKNFNKRYWWSSTENSYNYSWGLGNGSTYYYLGNKVYNYNRIFPFFAIKK
ncbi:MAG: hypothetical protein [Wendovervirus sonii]|uniref:DUF1566 domain-containing protein n=1 Tax=phage Lak_Megaphage_Sonny TaxID=3109229 RepID=A0ABZ0Z5D5_9CAUD|nr:MAG: hypothetical protein [phage Lak_Megaphage_Sonny]